MSTTREEIIALAIRLVRQKSYSSFSYDDISRELGITKAAVHYHFRNKEDLGVAVCESLAGNFAAMDGRHPWEAIEAAMAAMAANGGEDGICPLVSLQSDYENLPERVREALSRLVEAEIRSLVSLVRAYDPSADADAAVVLFLSMKGAMQYRRTVGGAFFRKMMKHIRERFYQLVPKRGRSKTAAF